MNEQEYDRLYNEAGDGYNPIREDRLERERREFAFRPKSIDERRHEILRKLSILDSSTARECGSYDQAKVDALRKDLDSLEVEFWANWTLEITKDRRAEWNGRVRSGEINEKNAWAKQVEQGWNISDLKKSIKHHNL